MGAIVDFFSALPQRADSIFNALSGLGTSKDKGQSNRVRGSRTLAHAELETLFRDNTYARRVTSSLPDDCIRRGWAIRVQDVEDGESAEDPFAAEFKRLKLRQKMKMAHTWARLYGGAAIILGIDDGLPASEPVNENGVRDIVYALVADRHELTPATWDDDPLSETFTLPLTYTYSPATGRGAKDDVRQPASALGHSRNASSIHASRILRFEGRPVPARLASQVDYWGDSVLQSVWHVLSAYGMVEAGAAHIVHEYEIALMKVKGLSTMIASQNGAELVAQRMAAFNLGKGLANMAVLDAESEDYSRSTASVAGLADLWDRFAQALAAAAEMPLTKLFGQSPKGLSTDDKSGMRWYYDTVRSTQEFTYQPAIERVARLLASTPTVAVERDVEFTIDFHPLEEPTEKERAEVRKLDAEADRIHWEMQVLEEQEIRQSAYGGSGYSSDRRLLSDEELAALTGEEDGDGDAPPA